MYLLRWIQAVTAELQARENELVAELQAAQQWVVDLYCTREAPNATTCRMARSLLKQVRWRITPNDMGLCVECDCEYAAGEEHFPDCETAMVVRAAKRAGISTNLEGEAK